MLIGPALHLVQCIFPEVCASRPVAPLQSAPLAAPTSLRPPLTAPLNSHVPSRPVLASAVSEREGWGLDWAGWVGGLKVPAVQLGWQGWD